MLIHWTSGNDYSILFSEVCFLSIDFNWKVVTFLFKNGIEKQIGLNTQESFQLFLEKLSEVTGANYKDISETSDTRKN
jgi:hypothetical protein